MLEETDTGNCLYCGVVDAHYDENSEAIHVATPKHKYNEILYRFKKEREKIAFLDQIRLSAKVTVTSSDNSTVTPYECQDVLKKVSKLTINAKPNDTVKYSFGVKNECTEDVLVVGIDLAHPQPHFKMNDHGLIFGESPYCLPKKKSVPREVCVTFSAIDIGEYEMPIFFIFKKSSSNKPLIGVCSMVIYVQEHLEDYVKIKSPYTGEHWFYDPKNVIHCTRGPLTFRYKVPEKLKKVFPKLLKVESLDELSLPAEETMQLKAMANDLNALFRDVEENDLRPNTYVLFFHNLLWWEEVIQSINLKKYNMANVNIVFENNVYKLKVPGLAEKRPSLLRGDRVLLLTCSGPLFIFESVIKDIEDDIICLSDFDSRFKALYTQDTQFNVRFKMSRAPMERMHEALDKLISSKHECRVFPRAVAKPVKIKKIKKFYNPTIEGNAEQKMAVQCIVSASSGLAPYLVYGPPGTGKTITIVEAIIQLVAESPKNKILVCTDSNMAADHVACMLLQYKEQLKLDDFLIRVNSRNRVWEVLPPILHPVSNGYSYNSYVSKKNVELSKYRVIVTTLLHSAIYGVPENHNNYKLQMTHLFIDEAAQSYEPACLVAITGLLAPKGQLILAGDPQQLGPICVCKAAGKRGLATSLMERLLINYENLYKKPETGTNYITMLKNNFRSHREILELPNKLFYDHQLKCLAPEDPLSKVNILTGSNDDAAIVFHSINSKEQRNGKSPSYYNVKELEMLQRYICNLIRKHNVLPEDIGVIAPYVKQVYKIRSWIQKENYDAIEVGTVEAFQGKEKRVILVTTVRANCILLDYDAKYGLGFLVDDKRFNVTLTRAKAKVVIIGNARCLERDEKWRQYMGKCKLYRTYFGAESEQIPRTLQLLDLVVNKNLRKYGVYDALENEKQETKKSKSAVKVKINSSNKNYE